MKITGEELYLYLKNELPEERMKSIEEQVKSDTELKETLRDTENFLKNSADALDSALSRNTGLSALPDFTEERKDTRTGYFKFFAYSAAALAVAGLILILLLNQFSETGKVMEEKIPQTVEKAPIQDSPEKRPEERLAPGENEMLASSGHSRPVVSLPRVSQIIIIGNDNKPSLIIYQDGEGKDENQLN